MENLKSQKPQTISYLDDIKNRPKKKRGRGRPRKDETENQEQTEKPEDSTEKLPVSTLAIIDGFINGYLAKRDDKWKADKKELQPLADSTDAILEKYLPSSEKWAIEASFLMCLIAFLAPRLNFDFFSDDTETEKSDDLPSNLTEKKG